MEKKIVRVGLTEKQHQILEAYQAAARLDGSPKPAKADVVVLALENGGFAFLKAETKRLKAEAKKAI